MWVTRWTGCGRCSPTRWTVRCGRSTTASWSRWWWRRARWWRRRRRCCSAWSVRPMPGGCCSVMARRVGAGVAAGSAADLPVRGRVVRADRPRVAGRVGRHRGGVRGRHDRPSARGGDHPDGRPSCRAERALRPGRGARVGRARPGVRPDGAVPAGPAAADRGRPGRRRRPGRGCAGPGGGARRSADGVHADPGRGGRVVAARPARPDRRRHRPRRPRPARPAPTVRGGRTGPAPPSPAPRGRAGRSLPAGVDRRRPARQRWGTPPGRGHRPLRDAAGRDRRRDVGRRHRHLRRRSPPAGLRRDDHPRRPRRPLRTPRPRPRTATVHRRRPPRPGPARPRLRVPRLRPADSAGATPTTSPAGRTAAPPPSTTASCCAGTTTDSSNAATGRSSSPPTASPSSDHHPGPTPNQRPLRNHMHKRE